MKFIKVNMKPTNKPLKNQNRKLKNNNKNGNPAKVPFIKQQPPITNDSRSQFFFHNMGNRII